MRMLQHCATLLIIKATVCSKMTSCSHQSHLRKIPLFQSCSRKPSTLMHSFGHTHYRNLFIAYVTSRTNVCELVKGRRDHHEYSYSCLCKVPARGKSRHAQRVSGLATACDASLTPL